jgi:uncharacterized RDD family membrane protein YckC
MTDVTPDTIDPNILPSPGLPRRLAALVYDTFLVLPLIMASVALAMLVQGLLLGVGDSSAAAATLHPMLVRLLALLTTVGFFCWFWLKNGQTLGMQAWRIKLVTFDGGPVRPPQALGRCAGALLSAACLGAGYWWCLLDRRGRYWHDYLSGTELRLLPRRKRGGKKA